MPIKVSRKPGAELPRRSGVGAPGGQHGRLPDSPEISDAEKINFIMEVTGVGADTVAQLSGEALDTSYKHSLKIAEKPKKRYKKGGVTPKKPSFMKGGSYKGKSHMYAAGGMVKELKM